MRTTRLKSEYFIALVFLLIGTLMVVAFFDRIPIEGTMLAVDWKNLYSGLQGGHIVYKGGSLMVAPWSLPAVIPLGFFSMRVGWGLLVMMTLGALIISVPRKGRRLDLLSI